MHIDSGHRCGRYVDNRMHVYHCIISWWPSWRGWHQAEQTQSWLPYWCHSHSHYCRRCCWMGCCSHSAQTHPCLVAAMCSVPVAPAVSVPVAPAVSVVAMGCFADVVVVVVACTGWYPCQSYPPCCYCPGSSMCCAVVAGQYSMRHWWCSAVMG